MGLFPSIHEKVVEDAKERVKIAYQLHKHMNPEMEKKMILAFSGGKDSICLFYVAKQAVEELGLEMKDVFHVQYNMTSVDPPELVWFIKDMKKQFPFIELKAPELSMWDLILKKKAAPQRGIRYCCQILKEVDTVKGGYVLTGVRRAESRNRGKRKVYEIKGWGKARASTDVIQLNDNEGRRATEYCMKKSRYFCNPIIDWEDSDVWQFIHENNLPYCSLYDEGWKRLGCIGCPLATDTIRQKQFERWPKYKNQYIRTFQKLLDEVRTDPTVSAKVQEFHSIFVDGQDFFDWWMHLPAFKTRHAEQEGSSFSEIEEDY